MDNIDKIIEDHQNKSAKLRTFKKKMKNRIPLSKIQQLLEREQKEEIKPEHYASWNEFDDVGYGKAIAEKEARIELLKEILKIK